MVDTPSDEVPFSPGDPEVFAGGLLGAVDVDGGPTDEQHAVLGAILRHVWRLPDLDLDAVHARGPAEVAERLTDEQACLRFCELAMVLELCRHPQSPAQVGRVEHYAAALRVDGIALDTTRTALERGAAIVAEDLERTYREILPEVSELQLRDRYLTLDAPDPALGDRLRSLGDLPPGTLGHEYVEFYRRNGFGFPGDDVHLPAHYVNHDMNHVITGYEPHAAGEVARSGFIWAAHGSRANWMELLLTLSIHESGVLTHGDIRAKIATLSRPGVAELLGEGLDRGQQCTVNLPAVDHLALVAEPLEAVRERFHVVPLAGS
jgi:ubiquinone biosynthesis protein Coq4